MPNYNMNKLWMLAMNRFNDNADNSRPVAILKYAMFTGVLFHGYTSCYGSMQFINTKLLALSCLE